MLESLPGKKHQSHRERDNSDGGGGGGGGFNSEKQIPLYNHPHLTITPNFYTLILTLENHTGKKKFL